MFNIRVLLLFEGLNWGRLLGETTVLECYGTRRLDPGLTQRPKVS